MGGHVLPTMSNNMRAWLIERTYSDDERNIITLVCATSNGMRHCRKEHLLMSFESDVRDACAAVGVSEDELGRVAGEETRELHTAAAVKMVESYESTDTV